MRKRTSLEWEASDGPLVIELDRYKARARGRRLKMLALLGLLAERHGLRLDDRGTGLVGSALMLAPPALPPADDATRLPANETVTTPVRTEAHERGLDRLLANFEH